MDSLWVLATDPDEKILEAIWYIEQRTSPPHENIAWIVAVDE